MRFKVKVVTEVDVKAKDFRVATDNAERLIGILLGDEERLDEFITNYDIRPISRHQTTVHVYKKED